MSRQPTKKEIEDAAVARDLLTGPTTVFTGFTLLNTRASAITLTIYVVRKDQKEKTPPLLKFSLAPKASIRWVAAPDQCVIMPDGDSITWSVEEVGTGAVEWTPADLDIRIESYNRDE